MSISDEQKAFLNLYILDQVPLKDISELIGVPKYTLSKWYEELREERKAIASIRTLWKRKKNKTPINEFYFWYISQERKCFFAILPRKRYKN